MLLAAAASWAKQNPGRLCPPGFALKRVRRRVELTGDGRLLSREPIDLASPEEKSGPRRLLPDLTRASGVAALLVADKASYAFGPGPTTEAGQAARAQREHDSYLKLLDACIADTGIPMLAAVRGFVGGNAYEHFALPQDWSDDDVVEFSVDGQDPLSAEAVRSWWAGRTGEDALSNEEGQCMVCGKRARLVSKFPQLKRIPGGQTSGSPLISFNKKAHEHYGAARSLNAPICLDCATASHGALTCLLDDDRHSRTVGPLRWVWWGLGNEELPLASLLFEADSSEVAAMLESASRGQPVGRLGLDRFVAVALAGNGGRAVVRSWVDTTLADGRRCLERWFSNHAVVGRDGSPPRPLPLWVLLTAAAPAPGRERALSNDAARRLLPRMVEAALLGRPVPLAVWQGAIGRIRATGEVTIAQAAVLKLALIHPSDPHPEVTMTSLDPDRAEPAYHCGRLLAVLDQTQRAALGKRNATVVDRFYGSASSSPSTSLPALIRGAQPHLAKLRRTKPGAAVAYERRLTEIMDHISHFPPRLDMRQQAEFALGYYHQRAADIAAAIAAKAAGVEQAPMAEEDIPDTEED